MRSPSRWLAALMGLGAACSAPAPAPAAAVPAQPLIVAPAPVEDRPDAGAIRVYPCAETPALEADWAAARLEAVAAHLRGADARCLMDEGFAEVAGQPLLELARTTVPACAAYLEAGDRAGSAAGRLAALWRDLGRTCRRTVAEDLLMADPTPARCPLPHVGPAAPLPDGGCLELRPGGGRHPRCPTPWHLSAVPGAPPRARPVALDANWVFDEPFGCDVISSVTVDVAGALTVVRLDGVARGPNAVFVRQALWLDGDVLRLLADLSNIQH